MLLPVKTSPEFCENMKYYPSQEENLRDANGEIIHSELRVFIKNYDDL